jgi:hypothetical protein
MRVLEAVRTAPEPTALAPAFVSWLGEGEQRHPVVQDVEAWCEKVARTQSTFRALGAPWATPSG